MDSAKIYDWLQVIAIFALVASLIFVGLQIKQTQEIGQGEAAGIYLNNINTFKGLIIENAEVWRNGCMDEELSEADQTIFAQVYYSYLSTSYFMWMANQVGVLRIPADVLTNSFAANMHRYPGFAKMFASKRLWGAEGSKFEDPWTARYRATIKKRLAELKEIEPEPLTDPKWCGNFS